MYITYRMPGLPTSKSLWPFSPQSIPGLALWLDAADASSVTGTSPVTAWRDKSGLGNNMSVSGTVSYASNKMTFSYGGIMTSANSTTITASVSMVFIVCQATALPNGNSMVFACPDLGGGDTSIRFYPDIQSVNNADTNDLGFTYGDDGTGQYYANGTLNGNDPVIVTTGVNIIEAVVNRSGSTLFTLSSSFYSRYFVGDIQEVIVYTGPITTEQRQQVEGYLGWKWGLQSLLPPTNPYSPYNSFQPTNISGCKLWLDAADPNSVILSDPNDPASYIVQWNDKSGNGNDMYTNTGDIFYTTSPQRSLQFVTEPTMITGNQITVNTSTSVFMVIKVTSVSDLADTLEFTDLAGGEGYFSIRYDAPTNLINADGNDLGYPGGYYVNGTLYSSSGITVPLGYNIVNTTNTTQSGDTRVSLSTTFMGRYFYGNIQEVIMYTTAITSTQRQQVQAYLSQKWNIPLSFPIVTIGIPPYNRIFQPVDISGCQLWLDAADASSMTFSSGTTVSAWLDKSGNGNNGTPNTEITWNVNGFGTSLPAMTFTNTQWFLGNISITENQFTAFCVFNMNSAASFYARVLSLGVSGENDYNNNAYICIVRLGGTVFSNYRDGTYPTIDIALDTNELTTSWVDGTTSYISQYGGTPTTIGSSGNFGVTSYAIGVSNNTADSPFYGYVAEVIVYNTALTLSQRQQVEAYLAWKWGLRSSLPSTHPGYILPSFSTTFTPKSLTGLQLWLDAADSSTVTGTSTVTSWLDKSGNGNNGTPISSGPTLVQNIQNGLPGITFPTTASIMLCGNILTGTNFSILAVIKYTSSGIEEFALGEWKHQYGSNLPFYKGGTIYATASDTTYGPFGPLTPADTSAFHMYSASLASSTSSPDATLIAGTDGNVATYTSTSGPNTAGTDKPFSVGGDYENITGYYPLTGYMCEVIVYNTALTLSQRQQVEGYLAWKWGLQNNLPSTHAYKKFRP